MGKLPFFSRKLKNAIKFLLFREDNPKHKVAEGCTTVEFLLMCMAVWVGVASATVFFGYVYFGVPGSLLTYILVSVASLEIPHIIWDR